jgi:uncharacterized protein (DUF302 family)
VFPYLSESFQYDQQRVHVRQDYRQKLPRSSLHRPGQAQGGTFARNSAAHFFGSLPFQCGFGVIATIDFQAAFKEKIGKETLRSISLGACNPALAWKVYQADESLAALLPCHVVVQEQKDNSTKVTMVEPSQMFSTFMMGKHPELKEVADDASTRLHKAMDLI